MSCLSSLFYKSAVLLYVNFAFISATETFSFKKCALDAKQAYLSSSNASFVVTSEGVLTYNLSEAWGITYEACNNICKPRGEWEEFDWTYFSVSVTSWVLPWLALTAQFPYDTKDTATSLRSLLLAVGSPMIATYSLSLTVLSSRWINIQFFRLRDQNRNVLGKQVKAIEAARIFLRESHHVPIGISDARGTLAQLIVSPENRSWWRSLEDGVMESKREWTLSLFAQIVWVVITVIIVVVNFFTFTEDTSTLLGVGVAINSLWVWMIPVILGFYWVGTQSSARTTRNALMKAEALLIVRDNERLLWRKTSNRMTGIRDRTGDDLSTKDSFSVGASSHRRVLDISLAGFELEPGSIFNFARICTNLRAAKIIIDGFEALNQRLESNKTVHNQPIEWSNHDQPIGWSNHDHEWKANLRGTPEDIEDYIYPQKYAEPQHISGMVVNYITAASVAVILQWGTTGAAILIAYKTPVIGLGCESGSYLIYGVLATFSWLLLVFSAYLSHRYASNPNACFASSNSSSSNSMDGKKSKANVPSLRMALLTIITRLLGETLALINALWLVLISLLQFTNLYKNCWCAGSELALKKKAWVVLWATDEQVAAIARKDWTFALVMSAVTILLVGGFFVVMSGEEMFQKGRR